MITVNNNIITMTKGDSVSFTLPLLIGKEIDTEPVDLSNIEKIEFNVLAPFQLSDFAYIKKEYTPSDVDEQGNLSISLAIEDTDDLEAGKYYYEVKLINEEDSFVDTIIPRRLFYIVE